MSSLARRLASLALAVAASLSVAACGASTQPQLKVLSVERSMRAPTGTVVVFVEVVNRDARPIRLQRLQYTFAAAGASHAAGEVSVTRVVEPGAGVVVEVPLTIDDTWPAGEPVTLAGRLFCEQDDLERSFEVTAELPASTFIR
jgi:LEA14-like dessication related protein